MNEKPEDTDMATEGERVNETTGVIMPPARNFSQLINEIEDGLLHQDLSIALQDMVAGLIDHRAEMGGKPKGTITLKLDIRLDGGTMDITPEVKIAMPKVARPKTVFYPTPENNLSRTNPRQRDMFLKDVSHNPAPTKSV